MSHKPNTFLALAHHPPGQAHGYIGMSLIWGVGPKSEECVENITHPESWEREGDREI